MFQILICFALSVSIFFTTPIYAPAYAASDTFASLQKTSEGEVLNIIDLQTLQLKDGRLVHLVGLDIPYLYAYNRPQNPDTPPAANLSDELTALGLEILHDMLAGQRVSLYQTPPNPRDAKWGRINRMNHHMAHIQRQSDGLWVQGTLLELGLARMRTTPRNPELSDQMSAAEAKARTQNLGLWADPYYRILNAKDLEIKNDKNLDGYHLIEGTIESTAQRNNRIYLNFGANWRNDFTISIAPKHRKAFSRSNLNPLQWQKKTVRVRGWLDHYNGPYIEITHPEQIEFLDNTAPPPSQTLKDISTPNKVGDTSKN